MELDGGLQGPRRSPVPRRRHAPRRRVGVEAPITVEPLEVYERDGDGHTLSRHCGTTPAVECERLARHPELPATGSFSDAATAQRAVEECVDANRDSIAAWRRRRSPRLVIDDHADHPVGAVLTRARWLAGARLPEPARSVRVVLRRNPAYPSGFAVLTAYPRLP